MQASEEMSSNTSMASTHSCSQTSSTKKTYIGLHDWCKSIKARNGQDFVQIVPVEAVLARPSVALCEINA
jgi:hypothetical protein